MNSQYDAIAQQYREAAENSVERKHLLEPTFLELLNDVRGRRVADLACGSGYFTRILKKQGAREVIGIDISREQISLAEKIEEIEKNGITYVQGNIAGFDLSQLGLFDVITGVFLLDYASTNKELIKMCANIYGALKKEGKFVAIVDNPEVLVFENPKYGITTEIIEPKDGAARKITLYADGKEILCFSNHYWAKETYEKSLKGAGFKSLVWCPAVVSDEGIKRFGNEFWKFFLEKPSFISITCLKDK